jgi:hypothetical protein
MFKKAALDFVGESAIGTETETSAEEAGDVALGGTLARALDGIDNAAQKAALRQLAAHAEIPIKRNAIHGWDLSLLRYSHAYGFLLLVWWL